MLTKFETNDTYKILIVDDQRTNLLLLEALIESRFNHIILKAHDAKTAINIAQTTPIDLIISDIDMPHMNGFEMTRELKKSEITKDIPIAFVSALDKDTKLEIKVHECGGIDIVSKPINQALFMMKLKNYFEIVSMQHEIKRKNFLIQ